MPKIKVNNPRNVIDAHLKTNYFKLRNTGGPKGDKGDKGDTGATGPEGPQGATGATGRAATVAIGTTQTLNPGQSAYVNNVGTNNDAIFNFGIPQGEKGDKGDTGATGATGQAATVTVGTTTTLAPGSDATVTNSGTSSAAVFNFGVPQGATGATGAQGPVGSVKSTVVSELPASGNSDTFYLVDREATTGTASGTSITFNNPEPNGEITDYDYLGDTTQQTYTGKNLFDYASALDTDNTTITQYRVFKISGLSANARYTMSGQTTNQITDSSLYVYLWSADTYSGAERKASLKSSAPPVGFDANENGEIYLAIYPTDTTTWTTTLSTYFKNTQLEAGYSATSYEPYVGGTVSPNPSYPQAVNTVTGRQEVDICGKNWFDKDSADTANGYLSSSNGAFVAGGGSYATKNMILLSPGNYVASQTLEKACYYAPDGTFIGLLERTGSNNEKFTMPSTGYIRLQFTSSFNANTFQLEQGTTSSDYEAYKSQTYELNLGKNLFNKATTPITNNGTTITQLDTGIRATITTVGQSRYSLMVLPIKVQAGLTYTLQSKIAVSASNLGRLTIGLCDADGNNRTTKDYFSATGSVSFTATSDDLAHPYIFLFVYGNLNGTGNIDDYVDYTDVQLEIGPATAYAPYFAPIELCKIGTYQDYIWNDGGTWKIHKETGKVVLDGTENWADYTSQLTAYYLAYETTRGKWGNAGSFASASSFMNDHFTSKAGTWANDAGNNLASTGYATYLKIDKTIVSDAASLSTWLGNHNTTVYHTLATPTDTAITDANLIAQLDALLNATLYNGQNNISVTSSAQPTGSLDMTYAIFDGTNRHKVYIWSNSDNTWQIIVQ